MHSFRRRFQYQNNRNSLKENTQIDKKEPETEIKEITITKAPLVENNKEKYRFKKREKKESISKYDNYEIKKEKKEEKNKFKEDMDEIEKVCASRLLKPDLKDIYEKVLESNSDFKDNIFFKNLIDTEKKVGKMDNINKEQISHNYKEFPTKKILRNIDNADNLYYKYSHKAKRIYN